MKLLIVAILVLMSAQLFAGLPQSFRCRGDVTILIKSPKKGGNRYYFGLECLQRVAGVCQRMQFFDAYEGEFGDGPALLEYDRLGHVFSMAQVKEMAKSFKNPGSWYYNKVRKVHAAGNLVKCKCRDLPEDKQYCALPLAVIDILTAPVQLLIYAIVTEKLARKLRGVRKVLETFISKNQTSGGSAFKSDKKFKLIREELIERSDPDVILYR